jgi:hypothetical protein
MRSPRGWPDSRTPPSGFPRGTAGALETWRSDGARGDARHVDGRAVDPREKLPSDDAERVFYDMTTSSFFERFFDCFFE